MTTTTAAPRPAPRPPPYAPLPDPETIRTEVPHRMQQAPRWLLWKLIPGPDPTKKPRKVPHYCDGGFRTGALDTPADLARLVPLETALEALEVAPGAYAGLGFALGPDGDGGWQGIDLDHTDTRPELAALVGLLPGYVERSPSGTGVHAVGYGPAFGTLGANKTGVEAYCRGRFFTVTGDALGGGIADLAPFVEGTLLALHTVRQPAGDRPAATETADAATIRDLRSALLSMRADDRGLWVNMGHALHALGDPGRGLWLEWSATSEKFELADAARVWDSLKPLHTGYQAVFAEAQRNGWDNPARRTDDADPGPWGDDFQGTPGDWGDSRCESNGEDGWPDLVPLDSTKLPRLPATLLPTWAGEFADALARSTETPPELALGLTLAATAVPCARRLRLMVAPGHFEPCNLWIAPALPPGNRKSAVQSAACAPLVDWEREACDAMGPEIARATADAKTLQARATAARAEAARAKDPKEIAAATQEAARLEGEIREPPKPPQLWTSDATPEKLGIMLGDQSECLAWLSSEAGLFDLLAGRYSNGIPNLDLAWLSSEAGLFDLLAGRYSNGIPNLDLVLKAWSGDPERVDRGSRPPVYLRCPRLTIGLSPQPEVLRGLSTRPGFRGRGLLARFVYLLPPSPLGHRILGADRHGATMGPGTAGDYAAGIRSMLDWPPAVDADGREVPHLLRLDRDAYGEWLAYARAVEVRMRPGGDLEGLTDLGGKAPGQAARIAADMHGIEHARGRPWEVPIGIETMGRALEVAAVAMAHSIAAMDMMGADPTIAAARRVWEWIERGRRTDATVREAFNALRGTFPRVKALTDALEALTERGYVRVSKIAAATPGRPPSPRIEVRPDIVEAWR